MDNRMVIVLFVLLAVLLGLRYITSRRERRLFYWRRSLNLDSHQSSFYQLYDGVDGFALSGQARLGGDAPEFVYGEIDFESFIALLGLCKPDADTVFYDLGSGTGKAVLACAMVFDVKKSCGVEWFQALHHCAQQQQERLLAMSAYEALYERIEFRQGDLCDAALSNATLIFINATAFFGDHWQQISQHLERVLPGTFIISTSKTLRSSLFETVSSTRVMMSWGVVHAFVQRRIKSGN